MKPGDPSPVAPIMAESDPGIYRMVSWISNHRAFIDGVLYGYQLHIKEKMLNELEVEKEAQEEIKRRGG